MRRLAFFLLVMTFTGAGVSYAETENPIQNFFLGNQQLTGSGFNQVLSLLVGPEGQPGPAGVRGRDGAAGLNGADGALGPQGPQGATGAPGLQGLPGQSVVAVQLAAGSVNCPNGGTQLTDGSGVITYVCNGDRGPAGPTGAQGATGATGATGAQGAAGTGSGGTSINGTGQISFGTCDAELNVTFQSLFVADGFILRQINMTNLSDQCNGQRIRVFFPIKTSRPTTGFNPNALYTYGSGASRNYIDCEMNSVLANLSGANNEIILHSTSPATSQGGVPVNRQFPMTCTVRGGSVITFAGLYTADVDENIGFQIGS